MDGMSRVREVKSPASGSAAPRLSAAATPTPAVVIVKKVRLVIPVIDALRAPLGLPLLLK
jgi:hypothetical protein